MAGERGVRDLDRLLASMAPERAPGEWVFVTTASSGPPLPARARIEEDEGTTSVVERGVADEHGLAYDFVAAWLTLRVHSALDAVGLTAAVAGALAEAGISCNVLAGLHHDHLLVPLDRADEALAVLADLSQRHRSG